jgi:hypothetical protein
MYKIIGADQKEYGPLPAEQIRQWITEGRLNGQTSACAEGSQEWKPLATFEEFAGMFREGTPSSSAASPGAAPVFSSDARGAALRAVKAPAICLIVTASLGVAYYLFSGIFTMVSGGVMFHRELPPNISPAMRSFFEGMQGPMAGVINIGVAALNGFVLFGAIKMLKLQNHTLAFIACIVAMLPCSCCCLFGLPFGIWGLIVLNKPEVKSQF